jgi:hypothetical protein
LGWFGAATPSATDWLTATSTAVLALAAPVSIWLVGRQIRDAQKASEDERNFAITPFISVTLDRTRAMAPRVLPRNATLGINWQMHEGAKEYAADLSVRAVGNGAAVGVHITFLPFIPMNLTQYIGVTNYPPTVEPQEFVHILPDAPKTIAVTWVRPMAHPDEEHLVLFMLRFLFRNAFGRQFSQSFIVNLDAPDKATLESAGPLMTVDKQLPLEEYMPLLRVVTDEFRSALHSANDVGK